MYDIQIDFGDNAIHGSKQVENLSDLASYLETIPAMMGFELMGEATVRISTNYSRKKQEELPIHILRK